MSSLINLSSQQLRHAATIKDQIQSLKNKLHQILGSPVASKAPAKPKRTMSAAARKKISLAAKARWAKVRAGKK